MINKFKLCLLAASAALTMASGVAKAAIVGDTITIQENAILGAFTNTVTADQLGGQYDEIFTVGPTGSTFASSAIFNAGHWTLNTVNAGDQIGNSPVSPNQYQIYVKFAATGTVNVVGGTAFFTATGGTIQVWADANSNTVYKTASTAVGTTGSINDLVLTSAASTTSDDVLLGSANVLGNIAGGNATGGQGANGNFELLFTNFTLTSTGAAYFIAPRPFDMVLDLNGNFQNFNLAPGASTQLSGSSANAFFQPTAVPEPNVLALAGLALVGAAVATRRKARKD